MRDTHNTTTAPLRRTIDAKDAATFLGLPLRTVYDLVRKDRLPHIKFGARVLFLPDALEEHLRQQMRGGHATVDPLS
ncbi:excise, DNA binding domain, excisionase family [uncultured Caudovirales phage]|uniref:Excise, DNA binding domain, excisionase family n=1 Tax=uncultured Caudovirales phage TaxID=2100421 RepID=A0A6J5M339_9CAUD|nr:excise, DNA binding domain, excisionase family [uncultured Caudovirales phage]